MFRRMLGAALAAMMILPCAAAETMFNGEVTAGDTQRHIAPYDGQVGDLDHNGSLHK